MNTVSISQTSTIEADRYKIYVTTDNITSQLNKPVWIYVRDHAIFRLEMHHNIYLDSIPPCIRHGASNRFNKNKWIGADDPYILMCEGVPYLSNDCTRDILTVNSRMRVTMSASRIDKMIESVINGDVCKICFIDFSIGVDNEHINIATYPRFIFSDADKHNTSEIKILKTAKLVAQLLKVLRDIETDLQKAYKDAMLDLYEHVKNKPQYDYVKDTFN